MASCVLLRLVRSASFVGIGLLLLIVALQPGCKRSTTVAEPEKSDKVAAAQNGDAAEITYKTEEGEVVDYAGGKKAVALPANFPADVPVYPKAMPVMTKTGDTKMTVFLNTPDSLQKVGTFYKEQLKEKGWQIKPIPDTPKVLVLEGEKEGRKLTVFITENPKETVVQLVVSKKK